MVARDPIEYEAGSLNLYELVHSSPMRWIDPFGLDELPPEGQTPTVPGPTPVGGGVWPPPPMPIIPATIWLINQLDPAVPTQGDVAFGDIGLKKDAVTTRGPGAGITVNDKYKLPRTFPPYVGGDLGDYWGRNPQLLTLSYILVHEFYHLNVEGFWVYGHGPESWRYELKWLRFLLRKINCKKHAMLCKQIRDRMKEVKEGLNRDKGNDDCKPEDDDPIDHDPPIKSAPPRGG